MPGLLSDNLTLVRISTVLLGEQVLLEPFDEIVIRKSPAYSEQS